MNEDTVSPNAQLGPGHSETQVDHPGRSRAAGRFRSIYRTIRERLMLLDYAPGERLSEGELAEEFNVSRTPVRRVLGRLEAEGLVETRHGVGTFVTSLDILELRATYRLRKELVGLVGLLDPIAPTQENLRAMKEIQTQCRQVAHAEKPKRAFARLNMVFFEELMKLVGNAALRDTLERLFYRTARMWPAMTSEELIIQEADVFYDDIREMLRFLEAGDVDAAFHLRRGHISMAFNRLESYKREGVSNGGDISRESDRPEKEGSVTPI